MNEDRTNYKTPSKLSKNILISVLLFSLAGQIAWAVENQYYNVFLYNVISPTPFYISLMVAITTIVGTVSTILMGSISDIKGKRKPFLLYGFIFWAITTALFPLSALFTSISVEIAVVLAITFDSIMTFFGGMALNAALNAYMTDVTTLENRGKLISLSQMMLLLSLLIVFGVSGILINLFGYYIFFYIIALVVGIFGIIGGILIKESTTIETLNLSIFSHISNTFKKDKRVDYQNFFIILIVIMCWEIAVNVFFPFLLIYLEHFIGLSIIMSSLLIFIAILLSIVLSYPVGILIDRFGRRKITFVSVLLFSISAIILGIFTEILTILIAGIILFLAYTSLSIATFTWIKDFYPEEGRGQFSGYWNLFSGTIPMIIGPLIGGWFATEFGRIAFINGELAYIPTSLIFLASGLIVLITLIPTFFAKELKKIDS